MNDGLLKNIAILSGGNSSEYVVSVKSAREVYNVVDKTKFNPYIVELKGADWFVSENGERIADIDKNDFSAVTPNGKLTFDAVLIMIHGNPGEDGKIQGYFDMLGMPYTTAGVLSMALTFNKAKTKEILRNYQVPMAKEMVVRKGMHFDEQEIIETIGLPCFIKPNNAGSSFGVARVNDQKAFHQAVMAALQEDDEVMIEQLMVGTEVTCGIVKTSKQAYLLPVTEIVSENEFFDYQAKYEGLSREITPARISDAVTKECHRLTALVYNVMGCKGISRVDFIIQNDVPHLLEINTVPGMSAASIIPQQVKVAGLSLTDIFTEVLQDSLND